jgi:release factor glutamine methyltransferase
LEKSPTAEQPLTSPLDLREAFRTGIARLRDANVPSYTLAAELLLLHVLQKNRTHLYAHPEELLTPQQLDSYFALIARRAAGEPTQHLTGKQEFWGLEFEVTPVVLIPRPETEHVVEVALDRLALREVRANRPQKTTGEGFLLADIGTGSGILAVTLAKELPGAQIYATDISPEALAVAQKNAARHNVENRIHFLESDLAQPIPSAEKSLAAQLDLVVSNPPYIPLRDAATLAREVRDHEPALALFGGEEGYELYAGLIALAAHHLKPGGILVAELGHDSLPAVQPLLDSPNWRAVGVTNDLAGIPRVIAAERTETT